VPRLRGGQSFIADAHPHHAPHTHRSRRQPPGLGPGARAGLSPAGAAAFPNRPRSCWTAAATGVAESNCLSRAEHAHLQRRAGFTLGTATAGMTSPEVQSWAIVATSGVQFCYGGLGKPDNPPCRSSKASAPTCSAGSTLPTAPARGARQTPPSSAPRPRPGRIHVGQISEISALSNRPVGSRTDLKSSLART